MKISKTDVRIPSSFRNPNGFLLYRNGIIYRQVDITYKENYDYLMNSSLYKTLVDSELLIPHNEVDKSILYPSITPVNSFRLIFNLYFNTQYELLPDDF